MLHNLKPVLEMASDQSFQGKLSNASDMNAPREIDQDWRAFGLTSKWLWPQSSAVVSKNSRKV